jgi:hypothetical protein
MATPIRWNNVNIRSGAEAASLGSTAAQFGRTAQAGFAGLATRLRARSVEDRDREDQLMTNEAISAALSGGPTVSSNRRVDPLALQKAVQSKGLYEEDIETSNLNQTGLGLSNRINKFTADNQEAVFKLEQEATRLGMDTDRQTQALNKFKLGVEQYDFKRQQKLNALDDTQRENIEALDAAGQRFEDEISAQLLAGTPNPTQEQINRARVEARARLQGPEGRQYLRKELVRIGGSEAAWEGSDAGRRDALAEQTAAAEAALRQEQRIKRIEREGLWNVQFGEGDYSTTVVDSAGNPGPGNEDVLKAQRNVISTEKKAIQHLNRSGVNTSQFDDKDKEAIEEVRAAFPTSSLFTPVVASWVEDDGSLDRKGMRKALSEGQRDMMLTRAGINLAGGGAGSGSGSGFGSDSNTGTREPGLRTPAEVVHAAATEEAAAENLRQLGQDVRASMKSRHDKLAAIQNTIKNPKAQAIANQFLGLFSTGKDPGRTQGTGSFFAGTTMGASDEVLGVEDMQDQFKDFDQWFRHVDPANKRKQGAAARADDLLKNLLESEQ